MQQGGKEDAEAAGHLFDHHMTNVGNSGVAVLVWAASLRQAANSGTKPRHSDLWFDQG